MTIQENYSLKKLNTFGIEAVTKYYAVFNSVEDLKLLLNNINFINLPKLIIGGGSNIIFTKDFDGLVLHNIIGGIKIIKEDEKESFIEVGAGVWWHDFVLFAIANNLGGVENLSLIPGTVGASPIQNIGAYGVEVKDVFHSLTALNIKTLEVEIFNKEDCKFGYRESVFKKELKGQYIILNVIFKLAKSPILNISYGAIQETLVEMGEEPTVRTVSDAVCKIRRSKLPNPLEIGNAGSFFKNPEITESQYLQLKNSFNLLPSYPTTVGFVKVPAGWLIEQCGWKGKTMGEYGVHKNQALVLVNYGNAKGLDIYRLSEDIKKSVYDKFNVSLETEVNIM